MSLTATGYVIPTANERLTQIQEVYTAVLPNINLDPETPQGLLIQSQTNFSITFDGNYLEMVNSINPDIATGIALDAIGAFTFVRRKPSTYTQVVCQVNGANGTVIPVGSLVQDTNNNIYALKDNDIIIDSTGEGQGTFQCTNDGAIVVLANNVTQVYQQITGWDAVNNSADGITGQNIEPDYIFRNRRTVGLYNGTQLVEAMNANINNIVGVVGLVISNNTASPLNIGGTYNVPVGYIAIIVDGGSDGDLAEFVYQYATGVGTFSSDTPRPIAYSPRPDVPEYPSYNYNIFVPAVSNLYITINAKIPAGINANTAQILQETIFDDYNNNRAQYQQIGQSLEAITFSKYCFAVNPLIQPISIFVGTSSSPSATSVSVDFATILKLALNNIVINFTLI